MTISEETKPTEQEIEAATDAVCNVYNNNPDYTFDEMARAVLEAASHVRQEQTKKTIDDLNRRLDRLEEERESLYITNAELALTLGRNCLRLIADRKKILNTLKFYADPETYVAIGFFPDSPAGEFMNDFEETDFGQKPGCRARKTLNDVPEELYDVPEELYIKFVNS